VTQPDHSTISKAAFTSAWIGFCRDSEGQHEYWRRFGDYLFTEPASEIPRELLSLPPVFRPRRRRRHRRDLLRPPDGLLPPTDAAAKLGCSVKTLNGHVAAGAQIRHHRPRHQTPAQDVHRR
jgi:hypothetical protein